MLILSLSLSLSVCVGLLVGVLIALGFRSTVVVVVVVMIPDVGMCCGPGWKQHIQTNNPSSFLV